MGDVHGIETLEQLRARMGEPSEFVAGKVNDFVDECFFHCAKAFRRSALWKPGTWQPHKVSFGAQFAKRIDRAGDGELIENIDTAVETDYREEL